MSESLEFSVDSSVSPVWVLVGEADGQPLELWVDWRAASRCRWRLGPLSGDPSLVPSQNGVWFDDQKRVVLTCASYRRPEKGEEVRSVFGEVRSVDLALKHDNLVAEGENPCVTGITREEQQADSGQDETADDSEHGYSGRMVARCLAC